MQNENYMLIQQSHKNLDSEIYHLKINDLEKQNQFLLVKLKEKNQEFIDVTEKICKQSNPRMQFKNDDFQKTRIQKKNVIYFLISIKIMFYHQK